MANSDQFNASSSMAGYLFQCRLALLLALQMLKKKANGQISIEKFDDISFETNNYSECLIQAKHHVKSKSLGDKSVDLWKTIRIWISQFNQGTLVASDLRFLLITTAEASSGSAMELLRPGASKSSVETARQLLVSAAQESKNSETQIGREEFLKLSELEANALLSRVDVLDKHSNLVDVMAEIEGELVLLSPTHASTIASYLEGWWLRVIGKCLIEDGSASIPIQNIIIKASEIGNMFKQDGLPIDDPETLGAKTYSENDEASTFVKQMRAVKLNERALKRGVQDYYRASAQRSKWARENLLLDGESAKYDATLQDQFERKYDAEISATITANDNNCEEFGRHMCNWASQQQIQFRNVVETWITAGSFHGLSERRLIGWHPRYEDLFSQEKVPEDA